PTLGNVPDRDLRFQLAQDAGVARCRAVDQQIFGWQVERATSAEILAAYVADSGCLFLEPATVEPELVGRQRLGERCQVVEDVSGGDFASGGDEAVLTHDAHQLRRLAVQRQAN